MQYCNPLYLKVPVFTAALAIAFLVANKISANSCELSGKTISVHFTDCPRDSVGTQLNERASQCWETRQRFVVLGKKIAHFADEITPEGIVFYIGDRIEVTNDKLQTKFLFGREFPEIYRRAWVTSSYSAGQLRMQTEVNAYFKNDHSQFGTTIDSFIFDIATDCSSCALTSRAYSLRLHDKRTGKQSLVTRLLDKQHSCTIRSGV